MLGTQNFPVFLAGAIMLNLMPGPDTLYIVARSVAQGRKAGLASVAGISSGSAVHAAAAALGLSAVLASSAFAFSLVKWLGVAYLIYMGLQLLLARAPAQEASGASAAASHWQIYRQGLLTNLLNPKVALFFLALLPQFVNPAAAQRELALLFLGAVFVMTGTLWCTAVVLVAASVSKAVRATSTALIIARRVAGGVFISLGLELATERAA